MNCFFFSPSIFKNAWEIEWCYKYYKFYFKELTNFAQIGQFLNVFSFSLELLWLFIVFLTWNTLKLTVSLSNKLYIISTQNLQEKGMSFLFLSTYFMIWVLFTWICELLIWFGIFVVSVMGWMNFCCAWIFGYFCLGF